MKRSILDAAPALEEVTYGQELLILVVLTLDHGPEKRCVQFWKLYLSNKQSRKTSALSRRSIVLSSGEVIK